MDQYQGVEPEAVRAIWHREMRPYFHQDKLYIIAWALDNQPEDPPNAVQFRNLCRHAPVKQEPQKLPPVADPVRIAKELEKLAAARKNVCAGNGGRQWIEALQARIAKGERLTSGQMLMLKQALDGGS